MGLPWWLSVKEVAYQCKRHGLGRIQHAAGAVKPVCHNHRAWARVWELQLLSPRALELVLHNKRSPHSGKPGYLN